MRALTHCHRWIVLWALGACSGASNVDVDSAARMRIQALLVGEDSAAVLALASGDTVHVSAATRTFYQSRRWRPAWIAGGELSPQGQKMILAVGAAGSDGLDPENYRYAVLTRTAASLQDGGRSLNDSTRARRLADLDIMLAEAFGRYATDLSQGTLDPDSAGLKWEIPRGAIPQANVLDALAKDAEPQRIVQQLRPSAPQYARLMKVHARLQQARKSGGWNSVAAVELQIGDSAAAIALLRARLSRSEDEREAALAMRGGARPAVFDRDLAAAIKYFQERHAIEPRGRLDDHTLDELNRSLDDRITEVRINMDRWRWLPHDLGRMYVMVNVAGFDMMVVENNRPIEEMNVVVGQEGWETPIFADTLENMVVNPYWNVPQSIIEEELSNLASDPGYLERNGFERTPDGGLRQRPGPKNALGKFKFQFPNNDNIYLHDTPADQLFSRSMRAFSHGCIRVERPRDLAYLLGGKLAGKTPEEIDALGETGSERWVKFRRKIPIYILYFTNWVDERGIVRVHHDVYKLDQALEAQTATLLTTR